MPTSPGRLPFLRALLPVPTLAQWKEIEGGKRLGIALGNVARNFCARQVWFKGTPAYSSQLVQRTSRRYSGDHCWDFWKYTVSIKMKNFPQKLFCLCSFRGFHLKISFDSLRQGYIGQVPLSTRSVFLTCLHEWTMHDAKKVELGESGSWMSSVEVVSVGMQNYYRFLSCFNRPLQSKYMLLICLTAVLDNWKWFASPCFFFPG